MTVIAALRLEGIPALIGDFLLTDQRKDLPHFPLPTRPDMSNPVGKPLPHRIHGMERKCLIINSRFAIGFTGHVPAAKLLFTELENKFGKKSEGPSLIQIDLALKKFKPEINRRKLDATIVGWTVRSRPRCFSWTAASDSKASPVNEAIVGSGATKFRASLSDSSHIGFSETVANAYERATLRGINIVGRVLSDELVSGHNLITGYGYGAEIALFTGTRFAFVPKIGYTFWNIRLDQNGLISLQSPSKICIYEDKGRYSLLEIIDSGNRYLAGLTPLHDNMGLILTEDDEPDMICPFYFIGIAAQDTRTGQMAMLRLGCMARDLSLFRIEHSGSGNKYFLHLNMEEVAGFLRRVFPDARWR
ncbi:hypothetical protein [Rhodopila sp.]|uniref:hypothetical protein n=1 Tax=Rhodopila sp. TaxID=2480087 RepID=UPI003D11573D